MLGLIREGEGIAAQVLTSLDMDLDRVRMGIMGLLGSSIPGYETNNEEGEPSKEQAPGAVPNAKGSKSKHPALDSFGRNLTDLAKEDKLDPVIGRSDEIDRVIQILSRRTKNNPVLIGEAGVGKTAIVEGLAQKIVEGNVPELLKDKKIYILDLALMVAGTKYRGQFEERIKAIMEELRKSKEVIIFIDEIHTLVGAGGAEGAIDASNMLKPALSRGAIQCIGATTINEYRKNIEKDAALERRFQTIVVEPPSIDETIEILKGLRDKYEAHHKVQFLDESLEAASKMSERYITGRFLPDKAIDLIDEAGAKARLATMIAPSDVKEVEQKLQDIKKEKAQAVQEQDFEKAAGIRDKERKLKAELSDKKKKWEVSRGKDIPSVDEESIAEIVSKWTGIPVIKLEEKESEKYMKMEDDLDAKVIGQNEAIRAIAAAARRSRAGIKDPERPIGSFIFMGPTGVGKTLLARKLAEFMFGNEDALIQIDMSEYMEKFNVSRLVGAPPGYVGYEEGGQLTEKVRRKPYSVVLLDEIEKAHPDVFNILLQVLEEGKLTDSFGRKVDFRNTILIMTTNVGADLLNKEGAIGFKSHDDEKGDHNQMKDKLNEAVKKVFKPEFINRVDDMIVFRTLNKKDLEKIVEIEIADVQKRLKDRDIIIDLNAKAKAFLIEKGFDKVFGARPLKRTIQRYLEDPLAQEIISGKVKGAHSIKIDAKEGSLLFKSAKTVKK